LKPANGHSVCSSQRVCCTTLRPQHNAAACRRQVPPLPHRSASHQEWGHRCHICMGTGHLAATSVPGPSPPLPHLSRDWAHPCHICASESAHPHHTGLGPTLPYLNQDCWAHPCHICASESAHPHHTGLGPTLPHLNQDLHASVGHRGRSQPTRLSRNRCTRGEPDPGEDVARVS
jgi:hypothetical protein